jgi:hypothetical protein
MAAAAPPAGKKRKRNELLLAGVAAVALIYMFMRRGASQPAVASGAAPSALDQSTGSGMPPSTFADNGAQAAALGDAVTSGLAGVQTSLESFAQAQRDAAQSAAAQTPAERTSTPAPAVTINFPAGAAGGAIAPGVPAGGGQSGASSAHATPVVARSYAQPSSGGPRTNDYHVVHKKGHTYHHYFRGPKKGRVVKVR